MGNNSRIAKLNFIILSAKSFFLALLSACFFDLPHLVVPIFVRERQLVIIGGISGEISEIEPMEYLYIKKAHSKGAGKPASFCQFSGFEKVKSARLR